MDDKQFKDLLEATMDSKGLGYIMDAIVDIARGKGEHVATNWQDEKMARSWYWTGRQLETASKTVAKRCPLW